MEIRKSLDYPGHLGSTPHSNSNQRDPRASSNGVLPEARSLQQCKNLYILCMCRGVVSHETSQEDTGTSTYRLPRGESKYLFQPPNDNNAAMPAKAEEREKQTGMVSGEVAGAIAEQATLKGLIVEMTKEFRQLKSDLGTRLDALQSRLHGLLCKHFCLSSLAVVVSRLDAK